MKIVKLKVLGSEDYFTTERLKTNLKKQAVKGAGATVISQIAAFGFQMISTIVLARLLTPEDFGLLAMVTSITMFVMMYRNLGLIDATLQREEIEHKQISTLFWINTVFSIFLTLIVIAISPIIAWFFNEPKLIKITIAISTAFTFGGISTQHTALLKRNMEFYKITVIEIIASIVSVVVAILIAWRGGGYWALVARRVVLAMVSALGVWLLCKWRPSLPALGTGVRPMLKFGINSLGAYTVNYFSRNLDNILIGWRYGTLSLGFYDKAYQLFAAPAQQLSLPFTHVTVATLSRLYNEPEKYRRYYLNAISMLAFIGMPISTFLTVSSKDVILMLLGPQWNSAAEIFSIFGLGIGIQLIYSTHGWLHLSAGRTDRWFLWGVFSAIVTIISFLIGLPFGPEGVAVAYTLSVYILIGPSLWYAGKPVNITLLSIVSVIWKYCFSATVSGLLCWFVCYSFDLTSNIFVQFNVIIRVILSIIVCISTYLFLVIILHKSADPIRTFFSLCNDMVPNIIMKKAKMQSR